jgi:hypothetical protein
MWHTRRGCCRCQYGEGEAGEKGCFRGSDTGTGDSEWREALR